jgi:CheY-like chemotaxis protein
MAEEPTRKKILLVDDNDATLRLEQEILVAAGFAVDAVSGGAEAMARLQATKYDAIVLDVEMPGMDGFQVARAIRELPVRGSNRATPIILVTGTVDPEARRRGFDAGVVAFVRKPFSPMALRTAVQSLIG